MPTTPTPPICVTSLPPSLFGVCLHGWCAIVCPSSKTRSCCGVVKDTLAQSQEIFCCDACGFEADRDINAAHNLDSY